MREVIAVCRSEKASRGRVARVLDRYFWRIGDRTWRGKATNACLDRVSKELRKRATRNTAVVVHEVRSSSESRKPIIRIGSRHAFSDDGVVPVSSHPADFRRGASPHGHFAVGAAVVGIAALFHDLGKAANLFQEKLRRALQGKKNEADAIRHELISAAVWDELFGQIEEPDLGKRLAEVTPDRIDQACKAVRNKLMAIHSNPDEPLGFAFIKREASLIHLIGMLILTHHRLPDGDSDHITMRGSRHVKPCTSIDRGVDLSIATGTPFWHENWWIVALREEARQLHPTPQACADIALRAALMFADHLGSAKKVAQNTRPDHLANTTRPDGASEWFPADSLSRHVKRVYRYARFSHDMTHGLRDRYPAIEEPDLPTDIAYPETSLTPRFAWQGLAARATRAMCETHEGGFFAAILAGTGTGKTRAAPTILSAAALADTRPERRYVRMNLALGLRVLASQSAREYVEDLGFGENDVSVLIGDPPLEFQSDEVERNSNHDEGSESLIALPEWLRIEQADGRVPEHGSSDEEQWLRGLSLDTERSLPAFLDLVLENTGKHQASGKKLLQAPIMVGTIDHLMGVASPTNSRFLLQSLRLMTSDLILDEIDQYGAEDLAAIARLVFQAGAMGRRVVIMSATLTNDIAEAFHNAYCRGWSDYASAHDVSDHVNLLICGDDPDSIFTNEDDAALPQVMDHCVSAILRGIRAAPPLRRAELLPPPGTWQDLVDQVDSECSRLHDLNAVELDGYRVSVGLVRMTRISHTTAIAAQLRSGDLGNRLRVLVCLHSQMPRLHRGYIEDRLKRALTRKDGQDPNKGVRALCLTEDVFARAEERAVRDIEIVVITTPVIETGNDVDFDWAIIDPISTRSVIQSAGRVCRHRPVSDEQINVLILGRSPIALQTGQLVRPGVETKSDGNTGVAKVERLLEFPDRNFADLAGDAQFATITAEPLLRAELNFPYAKGSRMVHGSCARYKIQRVQSCGGQAGTRAAYSPLSTFC